MKTAVRLPAALLAMSFCEAAFAHGEGAVFGLVMWFGVGAGLVCGIYSGVRDRNPGFGISAALGICVAGSSAVWLLSSDGPLAESLPYVPFAVAVALAVGALPTAIAFCAAFFPVALIRDRLTREEERHEL